MLLRRFFSGGSPSNSSPSSSPSILPCFLLLSALAALPARAGDVLETNGFSTCMNSDDIVVKKMNVKYDKSTNYVQFDLAGTSKKQQNVTAVLTVTAYGKSVYDKRFNPCDPPEIKQLCPLPQGDFAASDNLTIPASVASMIPDIAFKIPDLDGIAKLELLQQGTGTELACLQSVVQNGKTASVPEAKYATAALAGAALVLSGVSALGAGGGASAAGASPNFGDVMFWFQSIAMDGMLSVSYPTVYRSFSDNFQWSTGLVSWEGMQRSIDSFRKDTGGSLNEMSIDFLMNATLVYDNNITASKPSTKRRRDVEYLGLWEREVTINGTTVSGEKSNTTDTTENRVMHAVKGIQAKAETLKIPSANTFMTVLLIFCIVIASIAVCILLFKVILEIWALFASFPKALTGFRKRYWMFLATTLVRILLILYGTWTLYCLYQFTNGDSWGAHVLAGVTLATFTAILGFFAFRIITVARHARRSEGGQEKLFIHKPYMRKYGLFYDQFKSNFWWVFLPLIVYAFAKGAFIALGDGHGLVQTVGQLSCELFLLVLLLWNRPYNTKAGNVLNIIIACVRVLSVVCLIVFVDQLGIAADTKTVTGVALIAIQSTLTAALAICIAVNAIIVMCKENPHAKKRREQEEKMREADLTPLDARNSMLSGAYAHDGKGHYRPTPTQDQFYQNESQGNYAMNSLPPGHARNASVASKQGLMTAAAPMPSDPDEGYHYPPQEQIGVARVY